MRSAILQSAAKIKAPSALRALKVPKTQAVEKLHAKRATCLEVKIATLEAEKSRLLELPDAITPMLKHAEEKLSDAEEKIQSLEEEIAKNDSDELVELAHWRDEGGWGRWSKSFTLSTKVPIREVTHDAQCATYHQTYRAEKVVEGYFRRRRLLDEHHRCDVICYGLRRDHFADTIARNPKELSSLGSWLSYLQWRQSRSRSSKR